jgi:hypothetical protein
MTIVQADKPTDTSTDYVGEDTVLDEVLDNSLYAQLVEKLRQLGMSQVAIGYSIETLEDNAIFSLHNWKSLTASQKDNYPAELAKILDEMTLEMDYNNTISLFEDNINEGFRRSGCRENCIQFSKNLLRRSEVACLEVWNDLGYTARSQFPIELRSILGKIQRESESWDRLIPSFPAVFGICLLI